MPRFSWSRASVGCVSAKGLFVSIGLLEKRREVARRCADNLSLNAAIVHLTRGGMPPRSGRFFAGHFLAFFAGL
jgi:hypothetical protein